MSVRFLNVDLEIESGLSLEPIVDAFQASGLHCLAHIQTKRGRLASFEIADCPTDANDVVSAFCDVIERLGADARAVWESATVRRFDLGFRSDGSGPLFRSELKEMTLGRLAKARSNGRAVHLSLATPSLRTPLSPHHWPSCCRVTNTPKVLNSDIGRTM